jgi:hypothetical protein
MPRSTVTQEQPGLNRDTMTISGREYTASVVHRASRPRYTIQDSSIPAWQSSAISRLVQLTRLMPNWDSYGGKPVSTRFARITLELLNGLMREGTPLPSIVPTNSGRVQLEWHTKGIDLEVEVFSPIHLHVSFDDHNTGEVWERDLNVDLALLDQAIATLSTR